MLTIHSYFTSNMLPTTKTIIRSSMKHPRPMILKHLKFHHLWRWWILGLYILMNVDLPSYPRPTNGSNNHYFLSLFFCSFNNRKPSSRIFNAALMSLSWNVLHSGQTHSPTPMPKSWC